MENLSYFNCHTVSQCLHRGLYHNISQPCALFGDFGMPKHCDKGWEMFYSSTSHSATEHEFGMAESPKSIK